MAQFSIGLSEGYGDGNNKIERVLTDENLIDFSSFIKNIIEFTSTNWKKIELQIAPIDEYALEYIK